MNLSPANAYWLPAPVGKALNWRLLIAAAYTVGFWGYVVWFFWGVGS